jgi:hypothetical protein
VRGRRLHNTTLRQIFLNIKTRWLKLARGYELSERLAYFSKSRRTGVNVYGTPFAFFHSAILLKMARANIPAGVRT